MFKPEKNITILPIIGVRLLTEARFVFNDGKQEKAEAQTSGPLQGQEIAREEIEKRLKEGQEYNGDIYDSIEKLAEKSLKENQGLKEEFIRDKKAAINEFVESPDAQKNLKPPTIVGFNALLQKEGIDRIHIEKKGTDEYFRFSSKGITNEHWALKLPRSLSIEYGEPAPEKKVEPTDQQTALELFKKEFPDQEKKIRLGRTAVGEGSVARIPNVRNLPIYTEQGVQTISTDTLGEFRQSEARIAKPFTIVAPNDLGGTSEYVYIEANIVGSMGEREFKGWVEKSRLSDVNINKPEAKVTITPAEIKVEEEKKAPPAAEKPAEHARKVDETAETEEAQKQEREKKGEETRTRVLKGSETGKVKFTGFQDYIKTKIADIYPDAKEGDRVEIKRAGATKARTVIYENGGWHYTDKPAQRVTVEYNDELRLIPVAREQGPKAPENIQSIGYFRMKKEATWSEIAQTIMNTGKIPQGEEYVTKTAPDASPDENSPMAVLKQLGYDPSNAADVEKYATVLEQNNSDRLYIWVVKPKQNSRPAEEQIVRTRGEKRKEAQTRAGIEAKQLYAEENTIYNRHYNKLIENNDYNIQEKLLPIVNDEALWNHYWNKGFAGKEKILRGFQLLGVPEEKIRDILLDAITQGSNDLIDFEDLLDGCNNKGYPVFKNFEGEPSSFSDFKKEWVYQVTASVVAKNIENNWDKYTGLNQDQIDYYEENAKKYEPGIPEHARGSKLANLKNILQGSAFIMEGLGNLELKTEVAQAEKAVELAQQEAAAKKERREKTGLHRVERAPTQSGKEEQFLQQIFHPGNTGGPIEETPEYYEGMTDFEQKSSEATGYWQVKLNCSVNGKLDAKLLARELNFYIINAINKYRSLPDKAPDEKTISEKEMLRRRYQIDTDSKSPDFMNKVLAQYRISDGLDISSTKMDAIRNMAQDGFLISREMAEAKGGKVEAAPEVKEWKNLTQILEDKSETTQAVVRQLALLHPELTEEDLDKAAKTIETNISKTNLFDINAGVDTNSGKFQVGLSKAFDIGKGFSIAVGFAINIQNGQPMIGVVIGKDFTLSEQWRASVQAGAGLEPFTGKVGLGAGGGFTWLSKGEATDAWRTKIDIGAGVGSSISINMTDIYLGPYVRFGVGQIRDVDRQHYLVLKQQMAETGYANVDKAADIKEKANSIRQLPDGAGTALLEMQINLKMTDEELVHFYNTQLKETLKFASLKYVQASYGSPGAVSEWGLGVTVDPIRLTILIAVLAGLGPVAAAAVAVALFGKLGFVVSNKIELKQELKRPKSQDQEKAEKDLVEYLEGHYPGFQIEIGAQTFEDRNKLISSEFAGDQLQRIMRRREQPAQMEMSTFNPEVAADFAQKQAEFAQHHLKLEIDKDTGMYVLEPTEVQDYQFYADTNMPAGHGLILRGSKILCATSENLTQLFIKRFDYVYPREVDGTNLHTIITISDNPNASIGTIVESSRFYIESTGGNKAFVPNRLHIQVPGEKTKGQSNVQTYRGLRALGRRDQKDENFYLNRFYTSKTPSTKTVERTKTNAQLQANIQLSDSAFDTIGELQNPINLEGLPMSPDKFINSPKYKFVYRQLTTNTNPGNLAKLDALIRKENPSITEDQLILYKEELFRLSMTETKEADREKTIEQRLQWAEQVIYVPFFKEQLKKLQPPASANISAEALAKVFISAIRQNLKKEARPILPGEDIMTAVGTNRIYGVREKGPSAGQLEGDSVVEAFDYAKFLSLKGDAITEEQRTIARILLNEHSELPADNKAFLESRLAKKLFYMGKENEVPNPLIYIMGESNFKSLVEAYKALDNETALQTNQAAIDAFRKVCEKVRSAQLGEGIPVNLDGQDAMAVLVNGYYIVVKTSMMSGIYNKCSNPSTVYNELIYIYRPEQLREYPGIEGTVASAARDVTLMSNASLNVQTIGINAIAKRTFMYERGKEEITEGTPTKPAAGPASEANQAQEGEGEAAETGDQNE
jgi:hypothetical protein